MDYHANDIVENHLWMCTSSPNLFYAVSGDRVWLLTKNRLIDVYSKRIFPIVSLCRVSVLFDDLLYRFTTHNHFDEIIIIDEETPPLRQDGFTLLCNSPRFVFGKRPLSKVHRFNSLVKDRDYEVLPPDPRFNRHFLYTESEGHPFNLILSVTRGKPVCDHKLTVLDLLSHELACIKVKFYRYVAVHEEDEQCCLKCCLIDELWKRIPAEKGTGILLDYGLTRFLLCN